MKTKTSLLRAAALATIGASSFGLVGCEHLESKGGHTAQWTILEPTQRHPILVSQQPHKMSLRVERGTGQLNA
ncbi:MAG: hypothetical protein RL291_1815, partial [Pseudomonadota bacterium]